MPLGLGRTEQIDAVEVRWPDGTRQQEKVEGVSRILEIRQEVKNKGS